MRIPTTLIAILAIALGFASSATAQVTQSDSLALVAIYNATDGPNWTENNNWLTGPVSTWARVIVNENRVTRLDLYSNGLSGELPAEIGDLDALERLELSSNALTGDIPTSIGNCAALEHLDIHVNQFTGLPEELANCQNLTTIIAYKNELGDTFPDFLTSMHQLVRLEIGSNEIGGELPEELSQLINLRQLDLDRNNFEGQMPSVKNMTMLTSLHLTTNNLSGDFSDFLGDSTQLYYVTLGYNNFTGCLDSKHFRPENLKYLHLENNDADCLGDFSSFKGASLERIWCQGNDLDFDDLEQLSELGLLAFTYSPQDNMGERDTIMAQEGQSLTLSCDAGGTVTHYQWFKEGEPLVGANSTDFEINSFQDDDAGWYHCEATNDSLPGLTISRQPIIVIAEGTSSVSKFRDADELVMYPNPATSDFRISGIEGQVRLRIADAQGRLALDRLHNASEDISISGLSPGLYFITAHSASGLHMGRLVID